MNGLLPACVPRQDLHLRAAALTIAILAGLAPARAQGPGPLAPDVLPLTMKTPRGGFDRMVVSVTVCEPGTDRCATIDDVMVDTGSTGLRLEASVVPSWLHLPPFLGPHRRPLAECLRFVHDAAWGPLHRADVRFGGLTAAGLPLQVIADDGGPQPADCPRSDVRPTSNGTLGIGPHLFDCPGSCRQSAAAPGVFERVGDDWSPVGEDVAPPYRLPNPVTLLPGHDDGIVVDLSAPPDDGAVAVVGTLTFGIGGERLDPARIVKLDPAGRFTTRFRGRDLPDSYVDSGTETLILDDDRLPRCRGMAWAYCVAPPRRLDAEMVGRDGMRVPVTFPVGDYASARARRFGASDDVAVAAGRASRAFVWGAPFFLGRRVVLVLDDRRAPGNDGATGPFYAMTGRAP